MIAVSDPLRSVRFLAGMLPQITPTAVGCVLCLKFGKWAATK